MSKETQSVSAGFPIASILTIIFVIAKLFGKITLVLGLGVRTVVDQCHNWVDPRWGRAAHCRDCGYGELMKYLIYIYPVCTAFTFGIWQHSLAAGLFLFFILNVAAILRKG